jgi:site-specific DNA-methyltransferase (adenine-specific)
MKIDLIHANAFDEMPLIADESFHLIFVDPPYKLSNDGFTCQSGKLKTKDKKMRSVWSIPTCQKSEKEFGKHPTQKPLDLLTRIILAASNEGDKVFDPFMGSGTTGVVAKKLKREFCGIEIDKNYFNLAKTRITSI